MRRALLVAILIGASGSAHADGAFPDELQVFAPGSAPNELVLGANFGLLQSTDDAASWTLVCEGLISGPDLLTMYQLGPDLSIFAIYGGTVTRSTDQGCDWTASNTIPGSLVQDLFVDPLNVQNVWAISFGYQAQALNAIYLSTDGGATFGAPSYVEDAGVLNGIEASHTEGVAVGSGYLFSVDGGSNEPYLLRTEDLGATWTRTLHPEIEPRELAIAQVDPSHDGTVYLRVGLTTGLDALGITIDGGSAIQILLELGEPMSSFALGGDGTLYVGSELGHLWVRAPGANTFTESDGPEFRCLAERSGTLYACGNDLTDGFALGASTDRGATFTPLLRLQDIATLQACAPVQRECAVALTSLQTIVGYQQPVPDAGSTSASKGKGCGCGSVPGLECLALLALVGRRRRT